MKPSLFSKTHFNDKMARQKPDTRYVINPKFKQDSYIVHAVRRANCISKLEIRFASSLTCYRKRDCPTQFALRAKFLLIPEREKICDSVHYFSRGLVVTLNTVEPIIVHTNKSVFNWSISIYLTFKKFFFLFGIIVCFI